MQPPEISVAEAREHLSTEPRPRLIDCREDDEWRVCRIEGAELMPVSRFGEEVARLTDTAEPIIVYCHHGMRSMRVTQFLRQKGFSGARSMAGGIDAWAREIEPEMARY